MQYELLANRDEFDAYMEEARKVSDMEKAEEDELSDDDLEMVAGGGNAAKVTYHLKMCVYNVKKKKYVPAVKHFCAAIYYAI